MLFGRLNFGMVQVARSSQYESIPLIIELLLRFSITSVFTSLESPTRENDKYKDAAPNNKTTKR